MLKYLIFSIGFLLFFEGLVYLIFANKLSLFYKALSKVKNESIRTISSILIIIGLSIIYYTLKYYKIQ